MKSITVCGNKRLRFGEVCRHGTALAARGVVLACLLAQPLGAQGHSRAFPVKWSYFHHTVGDRNALNSADSTKWGLNSDGSLRTGEIPADTSMYTKLVGGGNVISGLVSGDYLHIQPTGKIRISGGAGQVYQAAGVFVDKASIRQRTGYQNRFEGIDPSTLRVASLPSDGFKGRDGAWSGQDPANQNTPNDFSIGMSDGPGVIVKVPASSTGNVFFFHTVNHSSFSTLERDGTANLNFTKVQPADRPRFTVSTSQVFTEGQAPAAINITRDTRTQYPVKVNYTILSGSAEAGQNTGDVSVPPNATGTLDFAPGETSKATYLMGFPDDGIYEGDETFLVRLDIIADDNPNEAYVEASHLSSYTYTMTLKDNEPYPTVTINSDVSYSENSLVYSGANAIPGYPTANAFVQVNVNPPSKHSVGVVVAVSPGSSSATLNDDYDWFSDPAYASFGGQAVFIPAGAPGVRKYIRIKPDSIFEGPENIRFYLNAAVNANVNPSLTSTLTITDAQSPPTISIERLGDRDVDEGERAIFYRITQSHASSYDTTVNLSYSGTAFNGSDFTGAASVVLSKNSLAQDFPLVAVKEDGVPEFSESVFVTLDSATINGQALNFGTRSAQLIIRDNDGGELDNTVEPNQAKLAGDASAGVSVTGLAEGTPSLGVWRIAGEPGWRLSGTAVTGLAAGFHEIEFRPFDGYLSPATRLINVVAGEPWQLPVGEEIKYVAIAPPAPVGLRVNLIGATGGQWKLDGESAWRDSGSSLENLPIGSYKIHFNPPPGFQRPAAITRRLNPANAVNEFNIQLIAIPGGTLPKAPAPLSNPETDAMPHSFVGRISTSNGFGTGTAVGPNSVLTAAHVLFDDRTLGYVTDVRYQNQAHRDYYQPSAGEELEVTGEINAQGFAVNGQSSIKPRGWVMLSGYAERRTEDLDAGMGSGTSGIESQNRDVAVAYFGKQVARGGHIGVRVTDPAVQAAGFWLHSVGPKTLVGYPVTQVAEEHVGKMHASAPSADITFSQTYLRVFRSNDLVGGPGISGGPLMVRGSEDASEFDWKVAAVYLGESVFGVYREIDKEVADIIGYAQILAGGDSTGDSDAPAAARTVRSTSVASLEVRCDQPGATWRNGSSPLLRAANQTIILQSLDFEVRFTDLDGWVTPGVIRGTGVAGKNTVVTGRYVAKSYATLAAALAVLNPGATSGDLGPMGDLNRNGTPNMVEWAFNLDPTSSGTPRELTPITGTSGLPAISVVGTDSLRRLKVEFVRMKPAVNPNLRYVPEFSPSLEGNSWTASGQIISRVSIDGVWERLVVEDTVLNGAMRFARLRIEEIPASN